MNFFKFILKGIVVIYAIALLSVPFLNLHVEFQTKWFFIGVVGLTCVGILSGFIYFLFSNFHSLVKMNALSIGIISTISFLSVDIFNGITTGVWSCSRILDSGYCDNFIQFIFYPVNIFTYLIIFIIGCFVGSFVGYVYLKIMNRNKL